MMNVHNEKISCGKKIPILNLYVVSNCNFVGFSDICGKFYFKQEGLRRHKMSEHGVEVFDN